MHYIIQNIKFKKMQLNNPNPSSQRDLNREYRKNLSINTFLALPFMSINFYDCVFFAIYIILTIGLLIYKVQKYPFPDYAIQIQSTILGLFCLTHYMRYQLGKQAISEKSSRKLIFYIIITVILLALYVFQIRLQMYVTLVEFVATWVGIAMGLAQFVTGVWVGVVYNRKKNAT